MMLEVLHLDSAMNADKNVTTKDKNIMTGDKNTDAIGKMFKIVERSKTYLYNEIRGNRFVVAQLEIRVGRVRFLINT